MTAKPMTMRQLLGAKKEANSGGSSRLANWKDNKPPEIVTWIHPRQSFYMIYQHSWPKIYEKRDKTRSIGVGFYNCLETEKVLKNQYFRHDDGSRKVPPKVCPFCLLAEYVRELVTTDQLDWLEPLFRYDLGNGTEARIIHSGGLYNAYKGDLEPEQKEQMAKAGVSQKTAFKENSIAKLKYIFSVVDDAHPENGCQVTTETKDLGDKVCDAIQNMMESLGDEEKGDPTVNPYAFKWKYFPNEPNINDKYRVVALQTHAMSDAVRAALDADPPDLKQFLEPWNVKTMRGLMEHYCQIEKQDFDWDRVFSEAEKRCDSNGVYQAPASSEDSNKSEKADGQKRTLKTKADKSKDEAPKQAPKEEPKAEEKPAEPEKKKLKGKRQAAPTPPPPKDPEASDDDDKCPKCQHELLPTENKCRGCGQVFEPVGDEKGPESAPF